jgi:hypothetical protein
MSVLRSPSVKFVWLAFPLTNTPQGFFTCISEEENVTQKMYFVTNPHAYFYSNKFFLNFARKL